MAHLRIQPLHRVSRAMLEHDLRHFNNTDPADWFTWTWVSRFGRAFSNLETQHFQVSWCCFFLGVYSVYIQFVSCSFLASVNGSVLGVVAALLCIFSYIFIYFHIYFQIYTNPVKVVSRPQARLSCLLPPKHSGTWRRSLSPPHASMSALYLHHPSPSMY